MPSPEPPRERFTGPASECKRSAAMYPTGEKSRLKGRGDGAPGPTLSEPGRRSSAMALGAMVLTAPGLEDKPAFRGEPS